MTQSQLSPVTAHPGPGLAPTVLAKRYLLHRILGVGGMGVVYKARDLLLESMGEPHPWVALKTLSRDMREYEGADALLLGEYRLGMRLRHGNVVKNLHFDLCPQHRYGFFTQELIAGETLEERLLQGPPPSPELRLKWARQLVAALQHCQQQGVIHADLKPANLLIDHHDDLLLFDFGIGRLSDGSDGAFRLNREQLDAWSYRYAAPELFYGALPSVDTDGFSLACVLHQLLSLQHPFGQRTSRCLAERPWRPEPPTRHRRLNRALLAGLQVLPDERQVHLNELAQRLAELAAAPDKWLRA
ncbi:serine/threonine-protein kinase [Oceanimonas sp. CHS3-5]|uniref:serine/threonine-protein kinase n=1 Tax=Oceanimonas sp. CHS3-5 TaxID=3068186 RepID=UPI00273FAB8E|nr:serine/threonine-protein kinase [Oceanimonas sp. CHS3-5]MDP5291699.1 serine/threonine-protein kinase [Oceanimonas sp. CHS3-5]